MDEYINRKTALENIKKIYELGGFPTGRDAFKTINNVLATMSAADVVEVVRCRYCKHWLKDVAGCTDFVGWCEFANYMVGAAGYCSYGERKDGDVV